MRIRDIHNNQVHKAAQGADKGHETLVYIGIGLIQIIENFQYLGKTGLVK